jgi:hypothetical protein
VVRQIEDSREEERRTAFQARSSRHSDRMCLGMLRNRGPLPASRTYYARSAAMGIPNWTLMLDLGLKRME